MADNIKFLAARRVYEFPPDVIRLSLLGVSNVVERVRDQFSFQAVNSTISASIPPDVGMDVGPVVFFNNGSLTDDDQTITQIRFLLFEQRRITIEVVGPSEAVAKVYDRLRTVLDGVRGPDGVPAVSGEPIEQANFTTLIAHCGFEADLLLAPALRRLYRKTWSLGQRAEFGLNPSLTVRKQMTKAAFPGATQPDIVLFQIEVRAGTRPGDRTYFSAAPLPTNEHIAYLGELEAALGKAK